MKVVQIITFDVQPGGMQDRLVEKAAAHAAITEESCDRAIAAVADRLQFLSFDTDTHGFQWHDVVTDDGHFRIRYASLDGLRLANLFDQVAELQQALTQQKDETARYVAALGREI
jgi:hypothetical protein